MSADNIFWKPRLHIPEASLAAEHQTPVTSPPLRSIMSVSSWNELQSLGHPSEG